ncbi:MAG: hypothetical protein AAGH87_06280 [Pseudomonadota bacterium]
MSVEMRVGEGNLPQPAGPMGWHDLIEDLVGVNLRGLRTLAAAFAQPATLFTSARARDWDGQVFSPSVRVYIFLIAVILFFQFIWGDASSPSAEAMREQFEALAAADPRLDDPELVGRVMNLFALVFPIVAVLISFIGSLLVRIWGAGTPILARIRLYFAAILPSTFLQLFGTVGLALTPASFVNLALVVALLLYWIADVATTYRGLAPVHARGGRIWRAILFGLVNLIAIVLASNISGVIAANVEIARALSAPG